MTERIVDEMTCQELVELVTDYFEGALSAEDRARFEMHLSGCRHCRLYLEQMRQTMRAVGSLAADAVAPEVTDALRRQFRDWKRR